jgi:DNA-binding CsgD family transcriptional regulator
MINRRNLDTSEELQVQRYGNGIKLIAPEQAVNRSATTIRSLMQLPFSVYFLDTDSVAQNMNEANAQFLGVQSVKDGIGKTLFSALKKQSARHKINHDQAVMNENKIKIFEDSSICKDGSIIHSLSIKSPWYDSGDKIIGIMGCTILLGKHALAESLEKITELGLLNAAGSKKEINAPQFSKREAECLHLLMRGKNAKEIAKILQLSHRTIENYLQNIKMKAGVSSKYALILQMVE